MMRTSTPKKTKSDTFVRIQPRNYENEGTTYSGFDIVTRHNKYSIIMMNISLNDDCNFGFELPSTKDHIGCPIESISWGGDKKIILNVKTSIGIISIKAHNTYNNHIRRSVIVQHTGDKYIQDTFEI